TGGWHCWGCTGGWHWWAGTGGWHWWAQVGGTAGAHVGALLGTGGGTAGNGWAGLVGALLGGTCGCHCCGHRSIRALIISALMIGADPRSDNCGSWQYFPHDLTA
ncbi:unnamed protein product, partial [Staurois parvus]